MTRELGTITKDVEHVLRSAIEIDMRSVVRVLRYVFQQHAITVGLATNNAERVCDDSLGVC